MVCPEPQTGRLGFVGDYTGASLTKFTRIRNWHWNGQARPDERRYSGTRYATQLIPSFAEYDGSFQGWGAVPPLFVGDTFTFFGYTAPTTGVACTPGCAFHVEALVERLTITWNWTAENKQVFWEIGFNSTDTPTQLAAFDDPCDDAPECFDNPCDLELRIKDPCAADALVEFCNITQATLTFLSNNVPYSNNSTGCKVKRKPAGINFLLDIADQNPCFPLLVNKDYRIEIEATATTHWLLKWAFCLGFTDYIINTETDEMIGKTNNFRMQPVSCCVPGTPSRGEIVSPAGVTLWPYETPTP